MRSESVVPAGRLRLVDGYYSFGIDDQDGTPNDAEGGDELFAWFPEGAKGRYKWSGMTTKDRRDIAQPVRSSGPEPDLPPSDRSS